MNQSQASFLLNIAHASATFFNQRASLCKMEHDFDPEEINKPYILGNKSVERTPLIMDKTLGTYITVLFHRDMFKCTPQLRLPNNT